MTFQTEDNKTDVVVPARLNTQAPIHELLANRRSPRAFSEQPIDSEKLASLFEAARWSPSSANEQPWRFIVATKDDSRVFSALVESLMEGNRRWAARAPMLVLALAQSTYTKTGTPYQHSWYDLGQSVALLSVQASALGLAVHQMGGFDADKARQLLSIPEGFEPVIVFAVGYPDQPATLPDDLRKREQAPRSRKLLQDLVYTEEWGKPSYHIRTQNSLLTQPSTN
ncbi:MAG: nitroreductase family protein [Ignavibacteriales bacterium]|nr:nitroreductase family protein [Ignavibacteriales bacterium]